MKMVINTGTSVIDSSDANIIANVLVNASGRNMRPSCASSRNTGTKDTMMIASEKKIARPTCFAARTIAAGCSSYGTASSATCRYAFSTMTIDASTRTPIASARPPSDMMFDVTPK